MRNLKLGITDFVFIATLVIALASGPQMLSIDSDLGRHLTLGNYILDEHVIPTRDLLSHTRPGFPRPPYEWLSQILFAIAYRLLNLDGIILFTALILAVTFSLVYRYSCKRSGSPILALCITLLAMGASTIHWLPRPHIISLLLLVVWINLLENLANNTTPKKLYLFPLIMLFWANLHGGFIFGILAWIAYFVGWVWDWQRGRANRHTGRDLLIVGILSLITTVITPDLWHNWDAVLNNRSAFILNRTVETMRPDLTNPSILPYTLMLSLTILFFIINRSAIKANHLFLLAGLGIMSLTMTRNIPLFVIACSPILSNLANNYLFRFNTWEQINERFAGFELTTSQLAWPVTATLIAIIFFAMFNFKYKHSMYQFDPAIFPVEATAYLQENPQHGNMFNEFNWGGYLLFKLFPRDTVFLDSQTDFYGENLMREYDQLIFAKGNWMDLLDKHQVEWAIIPSDAPLVPVIQREANWIVTYQDATATILRKP